MKNILILGKGYIASKIEKFWGMNSDYNLIFCSNKETKYLTCLDGLIKKYEPEYVINCYGFTGKPNVDSCEFHKKECHKRNVVDNFNILNTCVNHGVNFIVVSTGCVYNDENGKVFTEEDEHNFGCNNSTASTYSKSKSRFEEDFIDKISDLKFKSKNYLLRIRMPFDEEMDSKNYINKILKYDKLVNYKNSITYVFDLVKVMETIVQGDVPNGIYNVVNKNPITAQEIIDIYNYIFKEYKNVNKWYSVDDLLSENLIKCRRSNCVLSTKKIEKYYPDLLDSESAVKDALFCLKCNEIGVDV